MKPHNKWNRHKSEIPGRESPQAEARPDAKRQTEILEAAIKAFGAPASPPATAGEPRYRCPDCGTEYVCETPCGEYACRDKTPVPIAKLVQRSVPAGTAREWLKEHSAVFTGMDDIEYVAGHMERYAAQKVRRVREAAEKDYQTDLQHSARLHGGRESEGK